VYAHYAAIVQSSGIGKSRTVDEMGKVHFSIPINLRDADSTGLFYVYICLTAANSTCIYTLTRLSSCGSRSSELLNPKRSREDVLYSRLLLHSSIVRANASGSQR